MHELLSRFRIFWIITRAILILLFLNALIQGEYLNRLGGAIVVSVLTIVYIVCMSWILLCELLKLLRAHRMAFYISGIFSISSGLLVSYLVIITQGLNSFVLLVQIIPLWMITFGIYDVINGKKR
jgi:hypothetical protein